MTCNNSQGPDVVILDWETSPREQRAQEIARFVGADSTRLYLSQASLRGAESISTVVPSCTCLIVHAETLAQAADTMATGTAGLARLTDASKHIFIYGFRPSERHGAILRMFSTGGLRDVHPCSDGDAVFRVSSDSRQWCGQFSGLALGAPDPTRDSAFLENSELRRHAVLIRIGEQPFFVRVDSDTAQVFLLASDNLADLDEEVRHEVSLVSWFSRLAPLLMFLRGVLGDGVWHATHPRASFIIDDPLLHDSYGFLSYPRLLEAIGAHRFSVAIAFIPWNYRRSRQQTADLFAVAPDSLSLCVHGCDHTKAEFAGTDLESLRDKARVALERMQAHRHRTGVPCDDVMVFPQGHFSPEALKALEMCGYLAAVNTRRCPQHMTHPLRLRNLLDVTLTAFSDFPLFGRHYPRDPAEFAFDLFLGKPALVVEHHGYFRNGYEAIGDFVTRLNALEPRLEWRNLATICTLAHLRKVVHSGEIHVRFYTSRFCLTNDGPGTQSYRVFRRWTSNGPLPTVLINGSRWECEHGQNDLVFTLRLEPGQAAHITVVADPTAALSVPPRKPARLHNARILLRRALCEFRDNHVDTNPLLDAVVSRVRRARTRLRRATR